MTINHSGPVSDDAGTVDTPAWMECARGRLCNPLPFIVPQDFTDYEAVATALRAMLDKAIEELEAQS
jgi:hypothetical protein